MFASKESSAAATCIEDASGGATDAAGAGATDGAGDICVEDAGGGDTCVEDAGGGAVNAATDADAAAA